MARTLPDVSAPSSVVRSTILTARSSAVSLASFLIDRVASAATRSPTPTWSMPGSPCSTWRRPASEVARSAPLNGQRPGTSRSSDSIPTITTLPQASEAWFDHVGDDRQPLVERRERALHRVDRQPLDVGPVVAERLGQRRQL